MKLLFVCLCTCAGLLPVQGKAVGKLVNVAKYGAIADDGKDDTKALRKAVDYCCTQPGCTLYFPPGVYQLKDDDAVRLEEEALAGKFGTNPEAVIYTPYYPYSKGLDLGGATDLTLSAEGATLLCEGWMEPLCIENCTRVKVKGLTIDYKRKPFSSGEIISIQPDYFDVQFTDERIITDEMPLTRMTIWNKEKNRMYPDPIYFPKRELLGNNRVRFHHQIPAGLLGADAGVLHSFHFRPAILIHRSTQTELEGVTIHSQAGMGIVGFDSKDILIKRLAVVPAQGYYISTNTDATHFACCEGLLRFEGCTFQGQGDDATNVHGYYQSIVSASANQAELLVKAVTYTHAQVADVPRVGDVMELVEIKTLKPVRTYQVVAVSHQRPATSSQVTFSDNLPADFENYYLMNITKLPRLEFENSFINSHLARGILVKTRSVLINNNVFRNGTGTAVHVGAEASWHEGTHAKDVVITNNVMMGCGNGAGGQGGASGIAVIIDADDTGSSYLHDRIRIENNLIMGEGNPCGIYIGNADHVLLKQNRVLQCQKEYMVHSVNNLSVVK
ncbi:glycosyl hydrolase family 28-related protein [Parabacteroides goldsteinii]|uniref:glycosyl hydrolase family 28-related protein n=1 Tax=Parabacteroides goldsteinii TaxID=328812 RepID=UPI002673AD5E|nr:glycosyl hydrolase family 28-related protein [Parabacteroides goldsteinii]